MNILSQQQFYRNPLTTLEKGFSRSFNAIEWKHTQVGLKELGFNLSTAVKRKLSLGATILQNGGLEKVFKRNFQVRQGEMLVTASQCYLSTTAGPIAGLLFISSEKIAFLSERCIKLCSQNGQFVRAHYKVTIPLAKISKAIENKNITRPNEKYIEIVTVDNFDFWFLGFSNYRRTYMNLQKEISESKISKNCNVM
ncbi:putative GEM-like protein 8 [Impatiens glandulifera]|uniref:putative GEM-like protein 8 n=1 Tax=Impatiens glandulifera TaxID=253017 RepID=UPI001FB0A06B|nr:putative GEM-like protein 8 [Impatiens glandulifera]